MFTDTSDTLVQHTHTQAHQGQRCYVGTAAAGGLAHILASEATNVSAGAPHCGTKRGRQTYYTRTVVATACGGVMHVIWMSDE